MGAIDGVPVCRSAVARGGEEASYMRSSSARMGCQRRNGADGLAHRRWAGESALQGRE